MLENYASLYKYIANPPEIRIETGEDGRALPKSALLTGLTCRIPHKGADGEIEAYKWDRILICSYDPSFIFRFILNNNMGKGTCVQMGDMAIVEGMIRVKDKDKISECPCCGFQHGFLSPTVYIEPLLMLLFY